MPQYLVAIYQPYNYDPLAEDRRLVRDIDALTTNCPGQFWFLRADCSSPKDEPHIQY